MSIVCVFVVYVCARYWIVARRNPEKDNKYKENECKYGSSTRRTSWLYFTIAIKWNKDNKYYYYMHHLQKRISLFSTEFWGSVHFKHIVLEETSFVKVCYSQLVRVQHTTKKYIIEKQTKFQDEENMENIADFKLSI